MAATSSRVVTRSRRQSDSEAETQDRLLRAAAHLFAREGVDAVTNHEIHQLAGQRNESAVHYYFGNRANLLRSILEAHDIVAARMFEAGAAASYDSPDGFVAALVQRLTVALRTPEGRDWLRIVSQLMGRRSVLTDDVTLDGRLHVALAELARVTPELPADVAHRRGVVVVRFLTDRLAERARDLDDGTVELDDEEFRDELVSMASAMFRAPLTSRTLP